MVWKKVNNSDAGDSTHFGGNDLDKVSDLFSGAAAEAAIFRDENLIAADPTDTSKRVRLDAVGISTSTTRVLSAPDRDGTIITSADPSVAGNTWVLDEDNMASDSATKVPTQQSVKAYVDSQVTAQDLDLIADSGTGAVDLDSQSLTVSGGEGIDTSISGQTLTVSAEDATSLNKGIASFGSEFTVTSGAVSVNAIANNKITGLATSATTDTTNASNISSGTLGNARLPADISVTSLTLSGDLTVNGTTTTINSTTLTVDDKNIEMGSVGTPTDTTADGGGITLKGATDKTIIWDNANDNWTSSEHVNIATGKEFKVNNVKVLDATSLGSSVVSSSLTSVGTIASGTWSGTEVAIAKGGTGQTTAQTAINALTQVSGATNEYVLTKDTSTGNATWKQASTVATLDDLTDVSVSGQSQGDVLYFNGTNWTRLPAGTSGYFLKTLGSGQNPTWASAGGGAELNPILQSSAYSPTYTAPATEGTSPVSIWVSTIDANNQGVYAKIKKNGSYVTVQIA